MEFFNELYRLVESVIVWYFGTPLPKDTALTFYNVLKEDMLPLLLEYINTIL